MIRALIVDDEPTARQTLRRVLQAEGFMVPGESAGGADAVRAIRRLRPDVLFLDARMPGMDGFTAAVKIGAEWMPLTVFLTANGNRPLSVLEERIFDYVAKPIDEVRVKRTLDRVKQELGSPERSELTVKRGACEVRLRAQEVFWFEGNGNYVRVRMESQEFLIRETLKNLESRVDAATFVRIHRSTIVNVAHVREIRPWFTGEYIVVMRNGKELTLSRTHRASLQRLRNPLQPQTAR